MPRQLRVEYEGAVYHVLARGDRREAIYHDDQDSLAWIDYLGQVCRRTGWKVYGWVLMKRKRGQDLKVEYCYPLINFD